MSVLTLMVQSNSWIILTPLWDEMHIRMRTESSSRCLYDNPICEELSKFATVSYVFIDELVKYGLTLTMAYERGIQTDLAELQSKQCYVFLNVASAKINNSNMGTSISHQYCAQVNEKLLYYKSAVNFMKELYGKRNIFRIIQHLASFAFNAISITISNIRESKVDDAPPLESISSIVFKF